MAQAARFLQPIRSNASPLIFSFSSKFDRFQSLFKSLEAPSGIRRFSSSNWKSHVQRYVHKSTFYNSGRDFGIARLCGMSIVVGSVGLWPRYARCMDVYDTSPDVHPTSVAASDSEEDPPAFLLLVKKLLAPVILLYIVWTNWGDPLLIGVKTILILLSTNPSTYSLYELTDKWQRQFKKQHPLLHKFKSLYAKKVEIEDYTFLRVARVELDDKNYTLIGILGGWWVFEKTSLQGTYSSFKKRATEILHTAVQL